jgi:DNA polymerase elongation subunit (family B)
MFESFYTEVSQRGNTIFLRGYNNGRRIQRKVNYAPYLFVSSKEKNSEYKTLEGKSAEKISFENIREAKDFVERYKDVGGMSIYGLNSFLYPFLNDEYPGKVQYNLDTVRIINLDIECAPDGDDTGFPNIETANQPITAITCKVKDKITTFGCGEFKVHQSNVKYVKCSDEKRLLQEFIGYWQAVDPDVITGWNIEFFDVPYIINRIERVLDKEHAKRLSPWEMLDEKKIDIHGNGKEQQTYRPLGVCVLDYLRIYKKFTYTQQESYRLDHVAFTELGERKLDYSEYGSLTEMCRNNFQKYIEYNIHDVELVDRLEEKLGLLALGLTLAYDAKIKYDDMFTSIRLWDIIIHNYLLDRKIVVPLQRESTKDSQFTGAYVRDPKVGMHKWITTFDVNSLYPSLIVQNNMSPETHAGKVNTMNVDELLAGKFDKQSILQENNVAMSANGALWNKEKQGLFPEIVLKMYAERVEYNKLKKEAKQANDSNGVSRYHNLQLVKKIVLNSLFGATGNPAFRFYQNDYAEGITIHGQLAIRWVAQDIDAYLNKLLKTTDKQYVVYCDTDSVFVSLDDLVKSVFTDTSDVQKVTEFVNKVCSDKLEPVINKSFERLKEYTNSYVNQMKMKRENICDTAIFIAKKKYIMNVYDSEGVKYDEPKLYMKGIEAVKSSTPYSCREKIKLALKIIMQGNNDKLIEFIDTFRDEFSKLKFEEVAFPRGCNGILKYSDEKKIYTDGTPMHVRGALVYNALLRENNLDRKYATVKEGEKIKFCYMKLPNSFRENVISCPGVLPPELKLERYIDYNLQFDKAFFDPIRSITSVIKWKTEHMSTLEDFLNGN